MNKNLELRLKELEADHERDLNCAYKIGLNPEVIDLMEQEYEYLKVLAVYSNS